MITILIVIISLIIFILSFKLHRNKFTCDLPGPKTIPILGNALEFLTGDALDVVQRLKNEFGLIFRVYLSSDLYILLSDPVDIEVILNSYKHITKAVSYKYLKSWLGDGLITSHGETWYMHRKFLTPTFHFKILESSLEIIYRNSQILKERLKPKIDKNEFNVQIFVEKFSLDVIAEVAMDVRLNSQTSPDENYLHAIKRVTEISVSRIFKVWLQPDILFKWSPRYKEYETSLRVIQDMTFNVIKSKREKKIEVDMKFSDINASKIESLKSSIIDSSDVGIGKKAPTPFLDAMLNESKFSDREIYDEVLSFMFAGHDTTMTGTSFCIHQLANHADVQEKVYQEIMSVIPCDEMPTISDLSKLKYTECVIKETFRLYPPVPMIGRTLLEDVILPSGRKLPANSHLNILIYAMHRESSIFPEPEKFIPERFDKGNARNPFSFIPFSAGPRNCIGQRLAMLEIKITLVTLLKDYKLLPADTTKPLELFTGLILRSKNGLPIRIVRRN